MTVSSTTLFFYFCVQDVKRIHFKTQAMKTSLGIDCQILITFYVAHKNSYDYVLNNLMEYWKINIKYKALFH